jgi:hypothetical protein
MDLALAVDATRVARLRAEGYAVTTQTIPRAITAKNRFLLGDPRDGGTSGRRETPAVAR